MARLTAEGYEFSKAEELRKDLTDRIKKVDDYKDRPADINNNMINTLLPFLMEQEKHTGSYVNCININYASDEILFQMMAENRGIKRRGAYPLYVELTVKGPPGYIIPKDTEFSNEDESIIVRNTREVVIGSAKRTTILCYSHEENTEIPAHTIVKQRSISLLDLVITQNEDSYAPLDEEPFHVYKERVQHSVRAARPGSFEFLMATLRGVEGVDPKYVTARATQIERTVGNKTIVKNGIEVIVKGGDPVDIAFAIFNSTMMPQNFISSPSDASVGVPSARTVEQEIRLESSTFLIEFTRPLRVSLSITAKIKLKIKGIVTGSLQSITERPMESFINNLDLGAKINEHVLNEKLYEVLRAQDLKPEYIEKVTYEITGMGRKLEFQTDGYIKTAIDQYFTLASWTCSLAEDDD